MSDIWRRLARAAVRMYPRSWRARYGDEVEALLETTAPGPGVAADLAFGAIRERSTVLSALVWFFVVLVRAFALTMLALIIPAILVVLVVGPIMSVRVGFDWSEWASRRIFDVPYAVTAGMAMWFFFSLQFSLPVLLLLLLWLPIRRRRPVLARIVFTAAFSGFAFWLGELNQQVAMLLCGWLIAVKVFPTGARMSAELHGSLRTPAAGITNPSPVSESDPSSTHGLHRSTVTS